MPFLQDTRRWIKDQFSHDEMITISPKKLLPDIENNLDKLTPKERTRMVQHIQAYSDLYYVGRHKETIPDEVREQLRTLERRTERLNTVDEARRILHQYGGPPTRTTVQDSLDRSYKERAKEFSFTTPPVPAKTKHKEHTHTMEP